VRRRSPRHPRPAQTNRQHAGRLHQLAVRGGGHREAFLARWPGHIKPGSTTAALIAHIDTLATFAALTGQPLDPAAAPDSFNVLPALLGETPATPVRDHLVLQNNGQSALALREGEWVLIEKDGHRQLQGSAAGPQFELYNLTADLSQKTDLAAKEPPRVKAMAARLEDLRKPGHSRPE